MAEALLFLVLHKITTALGAAALEGVTSQLKKEASTLLEIESSMEQIESEFTMIQAFIREKEVYLSSKETSYAWLGLIRKVGFKVEDIIDEYSYLIGKARGKRNCLRKIFHHSTNVGAWHNIAIQLKQVEAHLQRLSSMKDRYGIQIAAETEASTYNSTNWGHQQISDSSRLIKDDDIVGIVKEAKRLMECLSNEERKDRIVISINGMGGSGKTTLASHIYRNQYIRRKFHRFAWISVSQIYQDEDLLRRILKQLQEGNGNVDTMDRLKLMDALLHYLQEKSYLIILDDVWDLKAWSFLDAAIPRNQHKSRIIITTRNDDVASIADQNCKINLKALSEEEAWHLFCKKAFSKVEGQKCPDELERCARRIVKKCQGLPLAIATVGGLLSYKEMNKKEWKLFDDQFKWQLANNPDLNWMMMSVFNLSFAALPSYLKNCFLYCSLFPEDYQIKRKWIIKLWIAEGFIQERGERSSLEDVADGYLSELAHRSLLQVAERNIYGIAKKFQMHDLVRDAALARSRKDKFGALWNSGDVSHFGSEARRLFVQKCGEAKQTFTGVQHVRSFISFDRKVSCSWLNNASSNFRLLRVLNIGGARKITKVPDVLDELFNLRYIDLSGCGVKEIPKSVTKLKNLETLDLKLSNVEKLPHGVLELPELRHLCGGLSPYTGSSLSGKIYGLKKLQTLQDIRPDTYLLKQLEHLTQLKHLGIILERASDAVDLWDSIGKMPMLTKLVVRTIESSGNFDTTNLSFPPNLEKLSLAGRFENGVLPSTFASLQNLRRLSMEQSALHDDPLPSFSQMSDLVVLRLFAAFRGQKLTFCPGWFPKLKRLCIFKMELQCIEIHEGTMESLSELHFAGLYNLKVAPEGIRYLRTLQKFFCWEMPREFKKSLKERDQRSIIEHIPLIAANGCIQSRPRTFISDKISSRHGTLL